jgi:hypothetical protein
VGSHRDEIKREIVRTFNKNVKGKVPDFAYRIAHTNHPTCVWVRHCYENYLYTVNLAKYLSIEYTYRYNKIHSCQKHIDWLLINIPKFKENSNISYNPKTTLTYNSYFESIGMTPVPLAMPDECKTSTDPILSYRNYYIMKKRHFARWTSRIIPRWYTYVNIRKFFGFLINFLNLFT